MLRRGRLLACLADEDDDADLVSQALRHNLRWQRAGLTAPPTQRVLSDRTSVALPAIRRAARVRVSLLFDQPRNQPHVIGLMVDYGWDSDLDRVRLAQVVWLDHRVTARELRPAAAALGLELILESLRAHAVRTPVEVDDDGLAAFMKAQASTKELSAHDRSWLHLERRKLHIEQPAMALVTRPEISNDDRKQLSVFGPGAWPAPPKPTGRTRAEIEIRNPGEAHRFMLQSGGPHRSLFFPEPDPPEEVDVLIAGAGLAGVATAYSLKPRRSLILEFDDRIAGTSAAGEGKRGRFPLAAHYEHELMTYYDADIIQMHIDLGIVHPEPVGSKFEFVDQEMVVAKGRSEQFLDFNGKLHGDVWNLMETPENLPVSKRMAELIGHMPLPARLARDELKPLADVTFADWARREGLQIERLLQTAVDTGFRSDYGGTAEQISAFAGLHYLTCRPYLTAEPRTLSPPQGLCYFAEKMLEHTPETEVRLHHLVRNIEDRGDHVEVVALDVREKVTRRFRAKHAVFAAPKKSVKWVYPADKKLFDTNVYCAWIVVTMEMARLPEKEMLFWSNAIWDPNELYIGVTWANHHLPDDPPIIGHYIVFPPGRLPHVTALLDRPYRIVRTCVRQLQALIGRDVSDDIERVVIQKLGHSMPTPVPGSLFIDPNAHRSSERIIYAGVDTGRLPLLIEAFDSGIEAARIIKGTAAP